MSENQIYLQFSTNKTRGHQKRKKREKIHTHKRTQTKYTVDFMQSYLFVQFFGCLGFSEIITNYIVD